MQKGSCQTTAAFLISVKKDQNMQTCNKSSNYDINTLSICAGGANTRKIHITYTTAAPNTINAVKFQNDYPTYPNTPSKDI